MPDEQILSAQGEPETGGGADLARILPALRQAFGADAGIAARSTGADDEVIACSGVEAAEAASGLGFIRRAARAGGVLVHVFEEESDATPASCIAVSVDGGAAPLGVALFRRAGGPAFCEADGAALSALVGMVRTPASMLPAQPDAVGLRAGALGVVSIDPEAGDVILDARALVCHGQPEDAAPMPLQAFLATIDPEGAAMIRAGLAGDRPVASFDYIVSPREGQRHMVHSHGMAVEGGRLVGIVSDVGDTRQSEAQQTLLIQELSHRTKNILQLVKSIADLAGRNADNLEDYLKSFNGRIDALSSAHDEIVGRAWVSADASGLARRTLRALSDVEGRVRIEIERADLTASTAQLFALLIHELATNAVKYGALSSAEGQVTLTGARGEDGSLALEWVETGGPMPVPPKKTGFGLLMLQRASRFHPGGETEIEWRPDGLVCRLTLPAE